MSGSITHWKTARNLKHTTHWVNSKEWWKILCFKHQYVVQGLVTKNIDLVMGDLTITPDRTYIIDFTIPFQSSPFVIIKRKPTINDSPLFAMFKPLSFEVWMSICISLLSGILCLDSCSSIFCLNFCMKLWWSLPLHWGWIQEIIILYPYLYGFVWLIYWVRVQMSH